MKSLDVITIGRSSIDLYGAPIGGRLEGVPLVKGFALGRTIFGRVARKWMAGGMDDEEAIRVMVANHKRLCDIWDRARAESMEKVA